MNLPCAPNSLRGSWCGDSQTKSGLVLYHGHRILVIYCIYVCMGTRSATGSQLWANLGQPCETCKLIIV